MALINPLFSSKYSRSQFEPNPSAIAFQKRLIEKITPAEKRFSEILSNLKIDNYFQHPLNIGSSFYILDFYVPRINLGFEIDGKDHYTNQKIEKDLFRESMIWEYHGIKIYRWSNKKVLKKSREIVLFLKRYVI